MMASLALGAGAFALGALTWSFLEYALHDWLGHWPRGKVDFSREHLRHHADTRYFSPPAKKLQLAVPLLTLFGLAGWAAAGALAGASYAGGIALAWLGYEVLHRRTHTHPPRGPYGRWARKHHLYHHFANPNKNHGVTSPIWDIVFGTYVRPGRITVPEKHCMPWLCDPESGEVWPAYAADYTVHRRGQRAPGALTQKAAAAATTGASAH